MGMSSSQLEAFAEVAKTGSFSRAAKNLHISQSALSQRVLNLEAELATALIVRDPAGLRLTPAGDELLRYWQVKDGLEQEVLAHLSAARSKLGGTIRIAGFSSVIRSVVMPALSEFVASNSNIKVEVFSRELRDLPLMLASNEVDVIVTTNEPFKQEIESHFVGKEENVLVTSSKVTDRSEIYLDHDPDDEVTAMFFALQAKDKRPRTLQRNYLDDVYSIMEGVRIGWGRAILPRHLIRGVPDMKIAPGYKPLRLPVMIQYYRQAYYSRLHTEAVACLKRGMPRILASES